MIKVNLLDSVTERPKGVAIIENRVSNPRTHTMMVGGSILILFLVVTMFSYLSLRSAHEKAQKDLEEQQRIAAQMAAIKKEQEELEKKTKAIQARIDAIQKLRASQQGPVAVLREIKDRINALPGLYLESVEQKGGDLIIRGNSPNEAAVTQFGRSLEFSSGLFTNLNIETQRKALPVPPNSGGESGGIAPADEAKIAPPETVDFTIKCSYTPPSVTSSAASVVGANQTSTASQVAQR
jgi:Tfp pilus assembly protein PilN